MEKTELKILIRAILTEVESGAAQKAKAAGLAYAKFGRWKDPKTGKVVAKSHGDELIKVTPTDDDPKVQMKKYQDIGQQYGQPPQRVEPAKPDISDPEMSTRQALAQRKMQQQIRQKALSPALRPGAGKIDPTWYNNTVMDLEDMHGLKSDDVSPEVMADLFKQRLTPEDAVAKYIEIKNDVDQFKKKECQRMQGENITKNDVRKIIREIILEELSLISEKWEDDVEVKKTGEHKDKSIEQLKREIDTIEKKEPFNRGEWSERMFALRAKQGWKGKGSTGTTEAKKPSIKKAKKSKCITKSALIRCDG